MGLACTHKTVSPVLTIGSCEIWGGKETEVLPRRSEFDVIVSLLGTMKPSLSRFSLSQGSRRLFANLVAYRQQRNNVISIDWPDMSAPDLDLAFWQALAADLGQIKGKAAIFCMGGHGRTGTALASLIQVSSYQPALATGDSIEWLRKTYCGDAVETFAQVSYLQRVIGVTTESKGTHDNWKPNPTKTYIEGDKGFSKYFRKQDGLLLDAKFEFDEEGD